MARRRNSFILILAVVSGFTAFIISLSFFQQSKVSTDATLHVVAAVRDIEIGSIISAEDVDLVPAPVGVSPKVLFTEFEPVMGQVTRKKIKQGEMIRNIDLLKEKDNLASLIPAGYRAMTIPVILPESLSSLLQVGNRVDVLLTYARGGGEFGSMTLVENARMIGISDSKGGEVSITLAVTPEGAETLAYAMKKGTLNVTIHSLSESDDVQERFYKLSELFFKDEALKDAVGKTGLEPVDEIEIIRGLRREKFKLKSVGAR